MRRAVRWCAQLEADRQEEQAIELERQREELEAEIAARRQEYEEMDARFKQLQAAALQGEL